MVLSVWKKKRDEKNLDFGSKRLCTRQNLRTLSEQICFLQTNIYELHLLMQELGWTQKMKNENHWKDQHNR